MELFQSSLTANDVPNRRFQFFHFNRLDQVLYKTCVQAPLIFRAVSCFDQRLQADLNFRQTRRLNYNFLIISNVRIFRFVAELGREFRVAGMNVTRVVR
jgi:hypothetical protein